MVVKMFIFLEIPVAENFAFSFNTLLSDVAKCCPSFREGIFEAQTELLVTLAKQVEDQINDQANMTQDKKRKWPSKHVYVHEHDISKICF